MSLINKLITQVTALTNAVNSIAALSKETHEFGDANLPLGSADFIRVQQSGVSRKVKATDLMGSVTGQVPSNWSEVDVNDPSFIENKPTKLSDFQNDLPSQQVLQSNWGQTNTGAQDFIKNKPTKLSDFQNDLPATNPNRVNFDDFTYYKASGNTQIDTLEGGDMVVGWWSATEFWKAAIYVSGSITVKTNYNIIDSIEF